MTRDTGGRLLLSAIAVFGSVGSFAASWNAKHLHNPRWPPHAKFHDAQTLAAGTILGLSALFFAWRRSGDRRTNDLAAVLFAGNYFWTQAAAAFFPGTAWTDPEFLKPGQRLDRLPPQFVMDVAVTALVLLSARLLRPDAGPLGVAHRRPIREHLP